MSREEEEEIKEMARWLVEYWRSPNWSSLADDIAQDFARAVAPLIVKHGVPGDAP